MPSEFVNSENFHEKFEGKLRETPATSSSYKVSSGCECREAASEREHIYSSSIMVNSRVRLTAREIRKSQEKPPPGAPKLSSMKPGRTPRVTTWPKGPRTPVHASEFSHLPFEVKTVRRAESNFDSEFNFPITHSKAKWKTHSCQRGHALTTFRTRLPHYVCSHCHESFPVGTVMRGCRICDYDVCPRCDELGRSAVSSARKGARKVSPQTKVTDTADGRALAKQGPMQVIKEEDASQPAALTGGDGEKRNTSEKRTSQAIRNSATQNSSHDYVAGTGHSGATAPPASEKKPEVFIITGPPAGGKGTQCEVIKELLGVVS